MEASGQLWTPAAYTRTYAAVPSKQADELGSGEKFPAGKNSSSSPWPSKSIQFVSITKFLCNKNTICKNNFADQLSNFK